MSQRTKCNVNDVESLLGLFEFILMKNPFNESHRIRCCSYLLSLSLFQIMDPSPSRPYIDPRNDSKLVDNNILKSNELKTALNTMTNNLSTINKVTRVQRRSASFLLLLIVMVDKINKKESQEAVCHLHIFIANGLDLF